MTMVESRTLVTLGLYVFPFGAFYCYNVYRGGSGLDDRQVSRPLRWLRARHPFVRHTAAAVLCWVAAVLAGEWLFGVVLPALRSGDPAWQAWIAATNLVGIGLGLSLQRQIIRRDYSALGGGRV